MLEVNLCYGKGRMLCSVPKERVRAVLTSEVNDIHPQEDEQALVRRALIHPIGSRRLSELAAGKRRIVIITSDHTRPLPSRITMPLLIEEILSGAPDADITLLVATGCHRAMTDEEKVERFGKDICDRFRIVMHDCDDESQLVDLGQMPSGKRCIVSRIAMQADLLVAEGFIEPHFFAGFSGGRKAVLPGVAGRRTVLENHCAAHIADPHARTGILKDNPIHQDMCWAARQAKLAFILNVVLNEKHEIIHAVAGDSLQAHADGCGFLEKICQVRGKPSDIVITTNGGYPLDQNVYQSVKGMTAAEPLVRKGGVIIMLAEAADGVGGDRFFHQLADEPDVERTLESFLSRAPGETEPDQWQTQIFIRVLQHAHVIYVSSLPDDIIRKMHMQPAHSVEEALRLAERFLQKPDADITIIPDGVSVISAID